MTPEEIIGRLMAAWNTGDGTGWASAFWEDAVFVDVLGRIQRGRSVIAEEHQKILDTIYRGSRLDIRLVAGRSIGEGLVLAHTTSRLDVPDGPRAGVTDAVQTKLVRDGLIVAFQNTIRADVARFAGHDSDLAVLGPLDWRDSSLS